MRENGRLLPRKVVRRCWKLSASWSLGPFCIFISFTKGKGSQKETTKTINKQKASKYGHVHEHNARKPQKRHGIRPPSPSSPQSPPCGARQSREEPRGQYPGKDRCAYLPSCIAFFVCSSR